MLVLKVLRIYTTSIRKVLNWTISGIRWTDSTLNLSLFLLLISRVEIWRWFRKKVGGLGIQTKNLLKYLNSTNIFFIWGRYRVGYLTGTSGIAILNSYHVHVKFKLNSIMTQPERLLNLRESRKNVNLYWSHIVSNRI